VERFIRKSLEQRTIPQVYSILQRGPDGGGGDGSIDSAREGAIVNAYRIREDKLKDFSKAIFSVASELLSALERGVQQGEQAAGQFARHARSKLQKFGEVLSDASFNASHNVAENEGGGSQQDRQQQQQQQSPRASGGGNNNNHGRPEEDPSLPFLAALDYDCIRTDLETHATAMLDHPQDCLAAARNAALVLQALRWRLAHAGIRKARKRAYHSYIQVIMEYLYWTISTGWLFCTGVSLLAGYFVLEEPYWLSFVYWNIPTD
jgi:hypothetical protein